MGVLNASPDRFQEMYDYFYPRNTGYLESDYRKWFDRTIFNPDRRVGLRTSDQALFKAVRGDARAFHQFMHAEARDEDGEFGETWYAECFLLLLCLDDQRFADLLSHEDRKTKEMVGNSLGPLSVERKYKFPKTLRVIPPPKDG